MKTTSPANGQSDDFERQAFRLTAVVAGVFALMIGLAMILAQVDSRAIDLLKPEEIQAVKEKLRLAPNDESLKTQVRDLDLLMRRGYFRQLALTTTGGYLLLIGAIGFFLATKKLLALDRKAPMPQPNPESAAQAAQAAPRARCSVAGVGAIVIAVLVSIPWTVGTVLPSRPSDLEKLIGSGSGTATQSVPAADCASPEEMARNWPRFRGPEGNGVSTQTNAPLIWNVQTGQNILWKVAVPAPGFNSPVVWGDRVFLSGGDTSKRSVYCFDALQGGLLWERPVQNANAGPPPAEAPAIPAQTGYAASTMATDGRRVYVIFANGDLAAFTLDGNPVWSKPLGVPKNPYGHAASLITWQDRLLVQLDQGESEQRLSKLYAFAGATGQILWQRPRPSPSSWATPLVISAAGKPQIITLGVPFVIAYAPADGAEIWRAEALNGEVTPSPIFAGGMVLAISPSEKLLAIRPDGNGDVTKTHVAWTVEESMPDIASPTSNGELVFAVTSGGLLFCFDAKDGKKLWEHDLATDCQASPSLVGDRWYVLSTKGAVIVAEAGRQFKELARTEMGEPLFASPAFANQRIFLRGSKHLFCLGLTEGNLAKAPGANKP